MDSILKAEKIWWWVSRYLQENNNITKINIRERWFSAQVYSAIRDDDFNTTNHLIKLAELVNSWEHEKALDKIQYIEWEIYRIIGENYIGFENDQWLQKILVQEFAQLTCEISSYDKSAELQNWNDYSIGSFSIMGFWEDMTTKIYRYLLEKEWNKVVYLSTDWLKENWEKIQDLWELLELLKSRVKYILGDTWLSWKVLISSGFISNLLWGINWMIWRGFTDAVTWLVALALLDTDEFEHVVFEIQKDVAGIFSTNPNDLNNPERVLLIEKISIEFAVRLFWEKWANLWLLNKTTINEFVIDALRNDPRFTVELKKSGEIWGEKTTIQKSLDTIDIGVKNIASRNDVPEKHRYWLGSQWASSLYLLWEKLGLFEDGFLEKVSDILVQHEINWANFSIKSGLEETLIVHFSDDYDPKKDKEKRLKALLNQKEDYLKKWNDTWVQNVEMKIQKLDEEFRLKLENFEISEKIPQSAEVKRNLALDVLHRELIENRKTLQQVADVA